MWENGSRQKGKEDSLVTGFPNEVPSKKNQYSSLVMRMIKLKLPCFREIPRTADLHKLEMKK